MALAIATMSSRSLSLGQTTDAGQPLVALVADHNLLMAVGQSAGRLVARARRPRLAARRIQGD
jgi:hypothetical protein